MAVQYYRDPGDGLFKAVPISGSEEVHVGPNAPTDPNIEWWIDTDDTSNQGISVADADARYVARVLDSPSGFRNVLRNGDMSIYQRGNGPFTAVGNSVDGWFHEWATGSASLTRVPQAVGLGSALISTTVSGQSGAGAYALVYQRVEGIETLAGQTVTLSFSAKAASGTPKVGVAFEQWCGTGGSPGATTATVAPALITLSTTMQRYSVTVALPSVVGKTLGTAGNHSLFVEFWYSTGTSLASYAPGMGIQANTFSITDVQLEAGSTATPFERLPIQQQLSWCQRYFYRVGTSNPNQPVSASVGYFRFLPIAFMISGGQATALGYHPVTMRAVPSATPSSPIANLYLSSSTTPYNSVTSIIATPSAMSAYACSLDIAVSPANLPSNVPLLFLQNGTASPAYIDFSAEL